MGFSIADFAGEFLVVFAVALLILLAVFVLGLGVAFISGVVLGLFGRGPLAPAKSTKVPAEVRAMVMARDNFTCLECGATEDLTVDHIIPRSKGGPSTMDNLQTLCRICNSRKGVSSRYTNL